MDDREVLGRADQILRDAGLFPEDPTLENFFITPNRYLRL